MIEICKIILKSTTYKNQGSRGCVHNAFQHFWKTNKYNEVGWLVLLPLDKVVKGKDELQDSHSLLKWPKWLTASLWPRRPLCLVAAGLRLLKAMRNLILWLAELKCKLNSLPSRVSSVKSESTDWERMGSVNWDRATWKDSDETGDTEPLIPMLLYQQRRSPYLQWNLPFYVQKWPLHPQQKQPPFLKQKWHP